MFLHANRTKIKGANGYYKYLRILETYYEKGKHKQRVVLNLGRVDKIGPELGKLVEALARFADKKIVTESDVGLLESLTWGKVLLARWLENTYVPDRNGNRWLPEWLPADAITKQQRVRVRSRQLQKWYRTLDALLAGKEDIEQDLYRRVCDLFSLKTDDATITAEESVGIYKQLSDVEWAYRDLNDVIAMRPIYHKKDSRVCAHIFVATLALFLKRALQHELARRHIDFTPTEAFAAMGSIGVSVLDMAGKKRLLTSSGGRDARRLVKALGIGNTAPPVAPTGPKNADR